MTIGVVMRESMSGWIRIEAEEGEHPFACSIRAFRLVRQENAFGSYERPSPA